MNILKKIAVAAALSASAITFSAVNASAAIVCSGDDCWHTHEVYRYPTESHVIVHADDWRWGDHDHFRWHEHEGRGFWHGSSWEDF